MFEEICALGESIDILINNAGISHIGLLQDMSIEEWNQVLNTNLTSAFSCSKYAIPDMITRKQGKIINISSIWGCAGASCEVAYSASKGGLNLFTQALAKELGCKTATNAEVAGDCDLIFLAVKPQMMEALLEPLRFTLDERPKRFVLCSMAAGLSIARIQELAGEDFPVIRIMPNTPASVGEGMIQYCSANVTAEEEQEFLKLMAPAGRLDAVPEALIDAASSVSGCGPAWVYQFIEALADGGVACGLPRAKAQEYAAQMVLGSAKLVLESGQHPGALKDAVCSPGGSTIQGVRVLEEKGMRGAVMDAVLAAYNKTKEMGKG